MKLSPVRVSPSFFPLDEAASALHSLRDRLDEPMIQELVARSVAGSSDDIAGLALAVEATPEFPTSPDPS